VIQGVLNINDVPIQREQQTGKCDADENVGEPVKCYRETLPNGVSYITHGYSDSAFLENTDVFTVPSGDYFMMGDNRDNSTDSRVQSQGGVGYVPFENIIGKAQIIFFSIAVDPVTREPTPAWEVWRWPWAVRWNRLLTLVR
jgi:signal peptidase I